MGEPIRFQCECGHKLAAPETKIGYQFRCPQCGADAWVPDPRRLAEPAAAVQPAPTRPASRVTGGAAASAKPKRGMMATVGLVFGGLFGACVLLGIVGMILGPDGPDRRRERSTEPAAAVETGGQAWRQVAAWTGNGIKNTESFDPRSREWKLTWEASGEPLGSILQIVVHDARSDGLVDLAANVANERTMQGESIIRGRGAHYLKINSANCVWTVRVFDRP